MVIFEFEKRKKYELFKFKVQDRKDRNPIIRNIKKRKKYKKKLKWKK